MHLDLRDFQESYEQKLLYFSKTLLEGHLIPLRFKGKKEEIYIETLEQLGKMFPRAVLQFLAKEGWEKKKYCVGQKLKSGHLWEHPEFKDLQLSFHEPSLQILLEISRQTAISKEKQDKKEIKPFAKEAWKKGCSGERLLIHLMSSPLLSLATTRDFLEEISPWNGWNQITFYMDPQYQGVSSAKMIQIVFKEFGWALPWLQVYITKWWLNSYSYVFRGTLPQVITTIQRMSFVFESIFNCSKEHKRSDWLLPLMKFSHLISKDKRAPEEVISHLQDLIKEQSHTDRQKIRDQWANLLRIGILLLTEQQRIRKLHPVEREGHQKLFLSFWEDKELSKDIEWIESLRIHLENVVG